MENEKIFLYGKYLCHLVSCCINNKTPEQPFDGIDWNFFYRLAELHKATSLIYPVLCHLDIPQDIMSKFTYNNHRMIAREARQEIEAKRIFGALEEQGIPFIKMKGIVMKNYYPMPYMRAQADVDLCMSEEDRNRCKTIMKDFGYEVFSEDEIVDEYVKEKFFYYEMHSSVNSSTSDFKDIFCDPFSKTKPSDDNVGFVFTNEIFYLHLITHLYKHLLVEGCGIKLFLDLYIFEKAHPDMDNDFIRKILSEHNIETFYDNVLSLIASLFSDEPFSEANKDIATFIFKCGDHGSNLVRDLTRSTTNKTKALSNRNKIHYILQIYFPPARELKYRYPILEKAPVLLPFYWVKRGFSTLFLKNEALKHQRKRIQSFYSDDMQEAKNVYKLIGINQDLRIH
ncbi:MAG: nucleotidyltransferase family protein [Ruminococcus sp.]|nr:nucleotidyltransferase family protein [Ruminococcus sp.]